MNKKGMKRGLALFTVFCLLFTMTGLTAFADTDTVYVCGEGSYVVPETQETDYYTTTPDLMNVSYKNATYDVSKFAKLEKYADYVDDSGNEFDITLNVYGDSFNPPVCKTVNILVLDYSSSMNSGMNGQSATGNNTRIAKLKAAAEAYINQLTSSDFLAIVGYDERAYIKTKFTQMTDNGKSGAISSVGSYGTLQSATNVQGGLIAAYQLANNPMANTVNATELETALKADDTVYNLIFMSDGGANRFYGRVSNNHTASNAAPATSYAGLSLNSQNVVGNGGADGDNVSASVATSAAVVLKALPFAAGSAAGSDYNPSKAKLNCYAISFTTATNTIGNNTLKEIASKPGNYVSANDWNPEQIFQLIRASQTENTIKNGTITDVIPAGFTVKDISAQYMVYSSGEWGTPVAAVDPAISQFKDPDTGQTTVTWSAITNNNRPLNEKTCVRLVIRVAADPICPVSEYADAFKWDESDDHFVRNTNVQAGLTFTNVISEANAIENFTAEFAVPAVHVPQEKAPYNVYYKYYVNGIPQSENYLAATEGIFEGAPYDVTDKVVEKYPNSDGADFGFAYKYSVENGTTKTAIGWAGNLGEAQDPGYAQGTIPTPGQDIYYDLYYFDDTSNLTLTKTIKKGNDETWPTEFSFTFVLKDGQGEPVAELTMDQDDFSGTGNTKTATGTFTLASGITIFNLLGKTLYLYEDSTPTGDPGAWTPGFTQGGAYVTVSEQGGISYVNGSGVCNDYVQTPLDAEIPVWKYFKVSDEESFRLYPGDDGSVLACGYAEHEHDASCYEGTTCGLKEHDAATCEDCVAYAEALEVLGEGEDEPEPCATWEEQGDHQHSYPDCYEGGEAICAFANHPEEGHTDACYAYTFTFTLTDSSGNEIDSQDLILNAEELKALINGEADKSIVFHINAEDLPQKGEVYTVTETSDVLGWNLSAPKSVSVSRLGEVTFGNGKNHIVMKNCFDELVPPSFEFFKSVYDARDSETLVIGYEGGFDFVLRDGETVIRQINLTIENGMASGEIELPEYLGKSAVLTLQEVVPAGGGTSISYDDSVYTITIENGELVSIEKDETPADGIWFENFYLEDITPEIPIVKSTNSTNKNGKFKFEVMAGEAPEFVYVETADGNGMTTYTLPTNFTGTITVKEVPDWVNNDEAPTDTWDFDDTEYMFQFNLGVLVEQSHEGAAATFSNNNYEPEIDLIKGVSSTSVLVNGTVTYTLTVRNSGVDEDLSEVKIVDSMLKGYAGTITVTKLSVDETPATTLVADEDYAFDRESGTITLTDDLLKGEQIVITYSIQFTTTGSHRNDATASGIGILSGAAAGDEDNKTVSVTTGGNPPTPPPGRPSFTTTTNIPSPNVPLTDTPVISQPEVVIPEPETPLADIPQTGVEENTTFHLILLGLSLSALAAMVLGRRRNDGVQ